MTTSPQSLLLVEDNPADVEYVSHLLEGSPYKVTPAGTFSDAERHLSDDGFHVVLLDLGVSGADPVRVAQRMYSLAKGIPVVALTQRDDDLAYACLDVGLQDFIRKSALSRTLLLRTLEHAAVRARAAEMARRLEVAERRATLGSIAAYVAHEVNNHAAVLLADTSLIHDDLDRLRAALGHEPGATEVIERAVSKLEEQAHLVERISSIISQLKSLSVPSTARRFTEVPRLVERTVHVMNSRLRQSAVVSLALEACAPAAIEETKLAQVLVNLLRNAAEAISGDPAAQRITIRTRETATDVRLVVSDTGCGITGTDKERLFKPMFSSKPDGAGLGLAICAEVVASVGGHITVESAPGAGSTFTVSLPKAAVRRERTRPTLSRRADRLRRRVLLVDDDKAFTNALALCLDPFHEVVVVSSGAQAVDILAVKADFDVVLCDLMMPGIDGVELYQVIRERHPELAGGFAVLSGGAFTASTTRFAESNEVMVIAKPCPVDKLLDAVDHLAARAR